MSMKQRFFIIVITFACMLAIFGSDSQPDAAVGQALPVPTITGTPPPCNPGPLTIPGDYDRDCDSDGHDYLEWQRQFGAAVPPFCGADGNGDGVVDAADYTIWADNYATTCESPAEQSQTVESKNYIHPSRGETYKLSLNLKASTHIRAEVYTIQGKKVSTLFDGDMGAGAQTIEWNGRNNDNSIVASDMYIVLIYENGGLTQKKKVIIER